MSATKSNEVNAFHNETKGTEEVELGHLMKNLRPSTARKPKKMICFTDGSTMEDPDDDSDDDENHDSSPQSADIETPVKKATDVKIESMPPVDPKTLSWPEWMKYYSNKSGSNVMWGLESAGESLAYYLGITTPKYQHEIDEYNRMVSKRKAEEAEAKAWASTNPSAVPIVEDQVNSENVHASPSPNIDRNEHQKV